MGGLILAYTTIQNSILWLSLRPSAELLYEMLLSTTLVKGRELVFTPTFSCDPENVQHITFIIMGEVCSGIQLEPGPQVVW